MKIYAGETWIELIPETEWEIDQLKRLVSQVSRAKTEVIDSVSDRSILFGRGSKLRFNFSENDWGT